MLRDVRYALRTLRNAPQFATVAILTLALGIGLATAVFTVADALLLRQLPVRDQDRLVVLWGQLPDQEFAYSLGSTTPASSRGAPDRSSESGTSPPLAPCRCPFGNETRSRGCAAPSCRATSSTCSARDPC